MSCCPPLARSSRPQVVSSYQLGAAQSPTRIWAKVTCSLVRGIGSDKPRFQLPVSWAPCAFGNPGGGRTCASLDRNRGASLCCSGSLTRHPWVLSEVFGEIE